MSVLGIIPARLGGKRLPDKVLLAETGHPLIRHVWNQAKKCKTIDDLLVACEVSDYTHGFRDGPQWTENALTKACIVHGITRFCTGYSDTGTDRCAWVAARLENFDIVVNIQADQPLLNPAHVDACVQRLAETPGLDIATPITFPLPHKYFANTNVVKCRPSLGLAVEFYRGWKADERVGRHLGIYAYRRECLLHLASVPQSWEEERESLEQIRFIREGCRIGAVVVADAEEDVNTREDYDNFVARWRELNPT
jgi:3-deoxy-manno-octulosonate cytidylyltransferase (CMP-KDO synthetase)